MGKSQQQDAPPRTPIDMRWLIGFVGLALAVGSIAIINGQPILRMLERFSISWLKEEPIKDLNQRYVAIAGAQAPRIQALAMGTYLYLNQLDGESPKAQEARFWQQITDAEPDNAVGFYLRAAQAIIAPNNAKAQYAAATNFLNQAASRPAVRWHVAASRSLWEKTLRAAGVKEHQAVIRANQIVGYQRGRALREGGLALCQLAEELTANAAFDDARHCAEQAARWARLSVESDNAPQIALAAAEILARAHPSLALLTACDGDMPTAAEHRESATQADRFLRRYRQAVDGPPFDMFVPGSPRTTRPTAFRMMLRALISVGVMAVATVAAISTLFLTLIRWLFTRKNTEHQTALLVRSRFWFITGSASAVSLPAWTALASIQLFPLKEAYLGSAYWIGATLTLVFLSTICALIALARFFAGRSTGESTSAIRVWYAAGLILAILLVLTMLKQWQFFGSHEDWFDAGYQLDWAVVRHRALAGTVAVLALLIGFVWLVVAKTEFRKADEPRRRRLTRLRVATLKATMILAGLGFLTAGIGTVLAERTYYRYNQRYRTLVASDLRDEVTARIGPDWHHRYFAPPARR